MSDFDLDDALTGQSNASGQQTQSQGQNSNPWGGPGQQYPGGYPQGGPQYPGGYPQGGPQYPGGYPQGGPQYPGGYPQGGPQYPGGYPGFPAPGPQNPGAPTPGQPADPRTAGQSGPVPPAPTAQLKLPYTFPMQAGIMPGLMLTIYGVIKPDCKRWAVDLKKNNDIALHINPRWDEKQCVTVRNSMIRGDWGPEERDAPRFPFQKAKPFMMQILCEAEQFSVSINNEKLFVFKHRCREFPQINSLAINGDIELNGVTATMM